MCSAPSLSENRSSACTVERAILSSELAVQIYNLYYKKLFCLDLGCALDESELSEKRYYRNLTEILIEKDMTVQQFMRSHGIAEDYISKEISSDFEKFEKLCSALTQDPDCFCAQLIRHELRCCFDIKKRLNESSCREIWDQGNAKLATPDFSALALLKRFNIYFPLCSTDPFTISSKPISTLLEHNLKCLTENLERTGADQDEQPFCICLFHLADLNVLNDPAGPDFRKFIKKLEQRFTVSITESSNFIIALNMLLEALATDGCFGISYCCNTDDLYTPLNGEQELDEDENISSFKIIDKALRQEPLSSMEVQLFQAFIFCIVEACCNKNQLSLYLRLTNCSTTWLQDCIAEDMKKMNIEGKLPLTFSSLPLKARNSLHERKSERSYYDKMIPALYWQESGQGAELAQALQNLQEHPRFEYLAGIATDAQNVPSLVSRMDYFLRLRSSAMAQKYPGAKLDQAFTEKIMQPFLFN